MACDGSPAGLDAAVPDGSVDAARFDGGRADADTPDGDPADGGGPDAGLVDWPRRSCDVTLSHAPPVGIERVRVAGSFTDWASGALDLRDDDGDGRFSLTLSPNPRLTPGQRYPYRFILGEDRWTRDPEAPQRAYADGCLNSVLEMPACDAGPAIAVSRLEAEWREGAGRADVQVTVSTALDGSVPEQIRFTLDGAPLASAMHSLDPRTGTFSVAMRGLALGRHVLSVRVTDAAGRDAEPVDLPFWIEEEPFSYRDALMYMIVVDRFANGERASDAPVGAPVEAAADFHGGDLWGVLEVLRSGYFEQLGVNVLWLSPINQQAEGHFEGRDGARRYAGYHGYWPSRGRAVEPRFGGDEALSALVEEAHRRGIRVLFDLINNQVHEQHEYYRDHPDWFRTGCVCGIDAGCGWSERPLECLFAPYLPDIDWRVPGAEAQFIADAVHWVERYGIDGFRIDAVKHVETNSVFNLRHALHRRFEQGGERLFLVGETAVGASDATDDGCGEVYEDGYRWIDAYVGEDGLDGQFDFPTHHALQEALVRDEMGYDRLEAEVSTLETRYRPEGLHVRFLGTHDSNRMASRAAFDPAQHCRWPDAGGCSQLPSRSDDEAVYGRLRRAFTALYTMPGIPFLYYGDEIAMPGGNDPDNRRDMVWTDALAPVSMGETTLTAAQRRLREDLAELGRARRDHVALRRGRRVVLRATETLYVVAWVHPDDLVIVALNRGGALEDLPVPLTGSMLAGRTEARRAAGEGAASVHGTELRLDLAAGASAVFGLSAP